MTQSIVNKQSVDSEVNLSDSLPVTLSYNDASQIKVSEDSAQLDLACDTHRATVKLEAEIKNPLLFRDGMRGLFEVVSSDYRYVPKDRAAYHAYRQLKNSLRSQSAWNAQQAYFEWLSKNDPLAYLILDPVVTVHPDEVMFEVFSKDEGSYAKFSLNHNEFESKEMQCGTSNVDFSENLLKGFEEFRSYRSNKVKLDTAQAEVKVEGQDTVLEKKVNVPESWVRAFLQVQTAATLSRNSFKLAAIDLYNVLRHLRMNADKKGKRRGIRIELVPGEYPRIILEPWEKIFECTAEKYQGKKASITRLWGRRRLMMLQSVLPYVDEIEVDLLGNALPSFWTLKSDTMSFTLGLTGYTAANWSQALNFDLLLPRSNVAKVDALMAALKEKWFMSYAQLGELFVANKSMTAEELIGALQSACQQGWLMYDLNKQVYRYRPLVNFELDHNRLQFRGRQDRQAHDLVSRKKAVTLDKENEIYSLGVEITGTVVVEEDKRDYQVYMLLNEEGGVNKAKCTCSYYRKNKLSQGPCAHLIALRIHYAQQQQKRLTDESMRKKVKAQTRTLSKRSDDDEYIYYITLDQHRIRKRWGLNGGKLRLQNMQFNSTDEARSNYYSQIKQLINKGYLDLSAGL